MAHTLLNVLGLQTPNLIPRSVLTFNITWARHGGRLIWATLLFLIGLAIGGYLTTRPKPAEPATWAKTVVGAVLVWVMLILGYGTIPHEWLQFAASYLNFGTDSFAVRRGQWAAHLPPFDITRQTVAHIVVVLIYGFVLTTNVVMFSRWQKRPVHEAVPATPEGDGEATTEPGARGWLRRRLRRTSAYGRPVTVNE
jgi:hypothetical protein